MDGTLGFRYSNSDTTIVEDEFEEFDIESETETFSFSFRQPVVRSPQRELALGATLDLRDRQTFLQGEPFSFFIGAEDGKSKVTVLRFFQDWVDRGLGVRWSITSKLGVRLDYGIPLIAVDNEETRFRKMAFTFSLRYQPF